MQQSSSNSSNVDSSENNSNKLDKSVIVAYEKLHKTIDEMDRKVELVIQKHESEFLYAYRSHIKKMKKELQEIKDKSEEQEKIFSANDRIGFLERENTNFRSQIINLYEKLEKKNLDIDHLRIRVKEAQRKAKMYEAQSKQIMLNIKNIEIENSQLLKEKKELQQSIKQKTSELAKVQVKKKNLILSSPKTSQFMTPLQSQQSSKRKLFIENNSRSLLKSFKPNELNDYQLKEWFVECVESVKKQVGNRKGMNNRNEIKQINNFEEFRLVDKLKLFEMFLQNQKILSWMYHKIFPDRMAEISEYFKEKPQKLSHDSHRISEFQDLRNSHLHLQQQYSKSQMAHSHEKKISNRYTQEMILPKVGRKKFSVRNSVSVKNGKLHISFR